MTLASFVRLDEHHQLAEDFAQVAQIDLVDDEHVGLLIRLLALRPATKLMENPILQVKMALRRRTKTLDKILVGIGLVELDHIPQVTQI